MTKLARTEFRAEAKEQLETRSHVTNVRRENRPPKKQCGHYSISASASASCGLQLTVLILILCCACNEVAPTESEPTQTQTTTSNKQTKTTEATTNSFTWPNKHLNVLIDSKSLNGTEVEILRTLFDQLEHKTCLKVTELAQRNAFLPIKQAQQSSDNDEDAAENDSTAIMSFIYIFKSTNSPLIWFRQPIGLSSLGCLRRGRQSLVLTDLAFQWPGTVLRYHLMRSLGVDLKERPDASKLLASSQRISSSPPSVSNLMSAALAKLTSLAGDDESIVDANASRPPLVASAAASSPQPSAVAALSEADFDAIKRLYKCPYLRNNLNPATKATTTATSAPQQVQPSERAPKLADESALERIASDLLSPANGSSASASIGCATKESLGCGPQRPPLDANGEPIGAVRPMLLKLDQFHAQDPQLINANQVKLSAVRASDDNLASYRLMDGGGGGGDWRQQSWPAQPALPLPSPTPASGGGDDKRREMLISFEQAGAGDHSSANPIDALVGSQVLKLCSCTCRTMAPASSVAPSIAPSVAPPPPAATTLAPTFAPPQTTEAPIYPTEPPPPSSPATLPPPPLLPLTSEQPPSSQLDWSQQPPQTTSDATNPFGPAFTFAPSGQPDGSFTYAPFQPATSGPPMDPFGTFGPAFTPAPDSSLSSTLTSAPLETEPQTTATTTTESAPTQTGTSGACAELEWVKPNKSVYASARIVWDVDRANQNYFLCQAELEGGELVPGKTHGFSCKISSEGKSYEMHQFRVLTKPEAASLAWIERSSGSLGKSSEPVLGGRRRQPASVGSGAAENLLPAPIGDGNSTATATQTQTQTTMQSSTTTPIEPYVVSRCLVRDENNDVITLIGYVNDQGVGLFPFDDIQIECAQYDVLACVSS